MITSKTQLQSEAQLENLLIDNLANRNFNKITISDIQSLEENFKEQFAKLNKKVLITPLTEKEWERIFIEINGKSVYQSSKILRDKLNFIRDDGSNIFLMLIDLKNIYANYYQVTNQVTVKGTYENRYDVTILINGLPIIQIELKRRGMDIKEAFNQIERYRRHSYQGLFRYVQIFVISNGVDTKYYSNSDGEILYSLTFFHADISNKRITKLYDFSNTFLEQDYIIKIISKYMVINDTNKNLMVLRPYQIFAVESLTQTAIQTSRSGFIWHTTGSGKTLTSFKCSQILAKEKSIRKVIFVVDRSDLDVQTTQEFNKFESGSVDITNNTETLVKQLADTEENSLVVTTIQKLTRAIANPKYQKIIQDLAESKVVIIFDECHRSTFGEWLTQIQKAFSSSNKRKIQLFGFTGTPRFAENKSGDGRTTSDIFGKCLHTYLIKEAIIDNNVLGFNVEYIKTFDGNIDLDDKTKVHSIDYKEVYESEQRIQLIANHIIASHNSKTRNCKYCAVFATPNISVLIKYYNMFKKIDHKFNISAIFSYGTNEDAEGKNEHSRDALESIIKDYNKTYDSNYSTSSFEAYNRDISKKLKSGKIDILIVVNMYLTGFDSKPLNTLYVDKNLEYHGLIQAYSRTNRVEKTTKPFGNIVCYRNLKNNTDDAIKLFSQTDTVDDILLKDFAYYQNLFNKSVNILLSLTPTPDDVDNLHDELKKKEFILAYRDVTKLLEVLKTFTDFDFQTTSIALTEQEYVDFRSKYLLIYDTLKNQTDKVSILDDIDFSIELIATDRINISYIMNLLRNIDLINKVQQQKDILEVKKEINRSDSLELRLKIDLIQKFLDNVIPIATPTQNVDDLYDRFQHKERFNEVEFFASQNNLDPEFLFNQLTSYEFSNVINKENILSAINKPFKEKRAISKKVILFIEEIVKKYK